MSKLLIKKTMCQVINFGAGLIYSINNYFFAPIITTIYSSMLKHRVKIDETNRH